MGKTALHLAAEAGKINAVKALIEGGADIDAQTDEGKTALILATEANQIETLRLLLRQNASPDIQDNKGYRALTIATEAGNNDAVEALALYSRNFLDDALFMASIKGHGQMIDTLTNYGASVYSRIEKDGRTPLMLAAQNGHKDAVRILLENGANRYSTDDSGRTASQLAMETGNAPISTYLAEKPSKNEFRISGENKEAINGAVQHVVNLERQSSRALNKQSSNSSRLNNQASNSAGVNNQAPNSAGVNNQNSSSSRLDNQASDSSPKNYAQSVRSTQITENSQASGNYGNSTNNNTLGTFDYNNDIQVATLNGRQLSSSADQKVTDSLSFKTYREETLPIKVARVDDKKVSIKYLYGDHRTIDVYPGETIPETNLKVVSAQEKRDHSKMTGGIPADVSEVMIEDPSTGQKRKMTTGLNVGKSEPFAVVTEFDNDALLIAKQGDIFKKSNGQEVEVLEVRATQLVLMNSKTGEVMTLKK